MCWKVLGWTFGEIEGVKVYLKIPMGNCRQEEELSPGSKQRPHLRFCPFSLVLTMSWPGSSFKSMDFGRPRRGGFTAAPKNLWPNVSGMQPVGVGCNSTQKKVANHSLFWC